VTGSDQGPTESRGLLENGRIYLRPLGLTSTADGTAGPPPEDELPLAGGPFQFTSCEVTHRFGETLLHTVLPAREVVAWSNDEEAPGSSQAALLLDRVTRRRPDFCELSPDRVCIMGVINVTPDSFSDGGDALEPLAAVQKARAMVAAGADMIDVGGESTRPGSDPVPADRQCERVLPVIRALARDGVKVSIDTRSAAVMTEGLQAGAVIVNDVSALSHDEDSLAVVARSGAGVVLMHMQGEPKTMQLDPRYDSAPLDIFDFLEQRIQACLSVGIERYRIAIDPGIGFGKTLDHNIEILHHLALYHGLGCPIVLGVSRKSFVATLSSKEPPKERLGGSLAAALFAVGQGVQILRVHDVAATRQALRVWRALGR
jgi:dihydropteroate synthase